MDLGLRNTGLLIVYVIPYASPVASLRLSVINILFNSTQNSIFESPLPEDGYLSVGPPCNLF